MRNKKLIIMFSVLAALVLLVVLTSVIFSVQHIEAYCYNYTDTDLEREVVESSGIQKRKSIFTLKEDKIAASVEKGTDYRVKVINIERKFPNRVYINYVRITPYAYITAGDVNYVFGNNLLVTGTAETTDRMIRVLYDGTAGTETGGRVLDGAQGEQLEEMLDTFLRLGYGDDVVDLAECIDLRFESSLFIRLRSGCAIRLVGKTDIFKRLRLAMSAYSAHDEWKSSGTIIVSGGSSSYSADDQYADALEKL